YSFNRNIGNDYKRTVWLGNEFNLEKYGMDNKYDLNTLRANEAVKIMTHRYSNNLFLNRADLYSESHLNEEGYPYSLDGRHISIAGSKSSAKYFENSLMYSELEKRIR